MPTSSSDRPVLQLAISPAAFPKNQKNIPPIEQATRRAASTLFLNSSGEAFHPYTPYPLPPDRRQRADELLKTHTFYCSRAAAELAGKKFTEYSAPFNQNQFYYAWIDGLLIGGNTGINNAKQLLEIIEERPFQKYSEIYSKLYLSLLVLSARGDFPRYAVEELGIKLVHLGLYPNDNLANLGTPLHLACSYGYSRLAEVLIDKSDAAILLPDNEGKTPAIRLAQHLQNHPLNDDLKRLKACLGNYFIRKSFTFCSNPIEAFDQVVKTHGFKGEQAYEIEPKIYQKTRTRLIEEKVERNKIPPTLPRSPKTQRARLRSIFSKIIGSKERISLPTVPENGLPEDPEPPKTIDEKIDYLETRFQYGDYPSQKTLFSHFLSLVTPISSPQWHLVERYCGLLLNYKDPYYDNLYAEIYFSLLSIIDFHQESANQARRCAAIIAKTGFDMEQYRETWKACARPLTGVIVGWSPETFFKKTDDGQWLKPIKTRPPEKKRLESLAERNRLIVQIAPTRARSCAIAEEPTSL